MFTEIKKFPRTLPFPAKVMCHVMAGLLAPDHYFLIPSQGKIPVGFYKKIPRYSGGTAQDFHPIPFSPFKKKEPQHKYLIKQHYITCLKQLAIFIFKVSPMCYLDIKDYGQKKGGFSCEKPKLP